MKLRICMQYLDDWPEEAGRPKKILLADDLDLFLAAENTFFRRRSVDLLIARTGEEAYALTEAHKPDLVFLALTMAGMDGDACCRKIRSQPRLRPTPVVLIAEAKRRQDLDRCCEAGCDEVLIKPLDRQMLLKVASRFLHVPERATPRVAVRLRVLVRQNDTLQRGYSVNLSFGGLFLESLSPPPVETTLGLRFSLPDSSAVIRCGGRVTWVNLPQAGEAAALPPGMGIAFTGLAAKDRELIEAFVKRQFIAQMR